MSAIFYKNLPYGAGGSNVEANPSGSASADLEKIGIDGTVYDVTDADAVHSSDKGVANGVASLDATGRVPSTQLPSYVDDVLEYASQSAFPATGESGKIYIALDTNKTYRWSGSAYVEISESLALGTTHSTAAYGDDAVSTAEPSFSEASTRANLAGSGEKLSVILGKIKKWFTDLKDLAFIGKDGNNSKKYLRGDGTWQSMFEGSVVGDIQIKDNDSGFTTTIYAVNDSLTGLNLINVPDKSGTMAVTSDIVAAKNDLTVIAEKTDTDPYIYRPSVANGDRVSEDIVGASVGWNQLIKSSGIAYNNYGITITESNGELTINGTSTGNIYCDLGFPSINNHVYFVEMPTLTGAIIYNDSHGVNTADSKIGRSNGVGGFYLRLASGNSYSNVKIKPNIHDLTTALGATIADHIYALEQNTAGAGVAFFRKYFPNAYYPYNAGELLSVEVEGKKYNSKNLLDPLANENTNIKTTNGITFIVNADGSITCNGTATAQARFYFKSDIVFPFDVIYSCGNSDSAKAYCYAGSVISSGKTIKAGTSVGTNFIAVNNGVTVSNYTVKPMIRRADVTDATYEPYHLTTYTFPSQTLRGLFTLVDGELKANGDVYGKDGTINRNFGIVNLGSLEWTYASNYSTPMFQTPISALGSIKTSLSYLVAGYTAKSSFWTESGNDKCIASGTNYFNISNFSYTDATAFKNAMNGVYMVYKLATPTIEQAEPLTMPQICDKNGTEEFITSGIVPVGHESTYYNYPDYMETGEYKNFRDRVDYTPEKAKWKKVGEYNDGETITINGTWNEIMICAFQAQMGGGGELRNSVIYPFDFWGKYYLETPVAGNYLYITSSGVVNFPTGVAVNSVFVYVR